MRGGVFFHNDQSKRGWFLVHPFKTSTCTPDNASSAVFQEHAWAQLPLKLCWAWTVRESQGMTMHGKIFLDIEKGNVAWGVACGFKQG